MWLDLLLARVPTVILIDFGLLVIHHQVFGSTSREKTIHHLNLQMIILTENYRKLSNTAFMAAECQLQICY